MMRTSILWTMTLARAAAACGDDAVGAGGSGGGGGGAGPSGTGGDGGAADVSSSAGGAGGDGSSSTGPSPDGPCVADSCSDGRECVECRYALGPGHQCTEDDVPGEGEFECDWLACAVGTQYCAHLVPQMDGCFQAACLAVPEECEGEPTCDCLAATEPDAECEEDADGNVSITKNQDPFSSSSSSGSGPSTGSGG
jgi:hypothetical protein